ncbi:hypothetical protein [Parvimonas parva]|uniref:Transposase n=1 Tax=Parvimonas parva TaxID=2769485 RepID=A0ABS1C9X8_9FIRM|nr:hypothetical protein [Parvimonas parva]MBK1468871.1 hypothetical protein [Parvimonas parva]
MRIKREKELSPTNGKEIIKKVESTTEKEKAKMQIKALLTFACQNMKKLANMMSKLGRKRPNFLIFREIYIKFKILINSKVIFN